MLPLLLARMGPKFPQRLPLALDFLKAGLGSRAHALEAPILSAAYFVGLAARLNAGHLLNWLIPTAVLRSLDTAAPSAPVTEDGGKPDTAYFCSQLTPASVVMAYKDGPDGKDHLTKLSWPELTADCADHGTPIKSTNLVVQMAPWLRPVTQSVRGSPTFQWPDLAALPFLGVHESFPSWLQPVPARPKSMLGIFPTPTYKPATLGLQ